VERCVVIANAPWRWTGEMVSLVRAAKLIVAADGGANHLARIGVRADAVVGDLDSVAEGTRLWLGEERMVLEAEQETTDLHKALAYAVRDRGAERVTVLAALGGRPDHALENLAVVARWRPHVEVVVREPGLLAVPVIGEAEIAVRPGQTVSLLPLGACPAVTTTGLRWELAGEPLDLLGRTSVSNVATGELVTIAVAAGALIAFVHAAVEDC
jgi:thiamine pyrophosphokinase